MDAMISTMQFVRLTDWVAILSGMICYADIGRDMGRVISPIYDPPLIAEFVVISPARRTLSAQSQLFLEILEAEIVAHRGCLGEDHSARGLSCRAAACGIALEHDPEKWMPLFGKDHAQSKCRSWI